MSTRVVPLPLSISNAFLVLGDRPVLVDAGSPGDGDRLVAGLRTHGITPNDLSLVVLTHGHTDHTGAVAAAASGGAPVAIGRADAPSLLAGTNDALVPTGPVGAALKLHMTRQHFPGFTPQLQLDGARRLDEFGVGGELVPVGGHTPGSYVVLLDDGGDAIVSDLVRGGFAGGRVRPGHPLRHYFTEDRAANRAGLERVLAHGPTTIHVGHGGPLAATDVRRRLDAIT
ncbi:MBL fold metallo-hydrolase [Cryptosporangium phraense]|uniref:MBL fold metallo-hydrolase n=1 Tax=Cryptosporangium phraense TaxID=2593070 RepID=A0A545ANT2_9ACTN|nr:MBL fold metallo-hydrolase [Cryptosporangium phraense]TQS42999.1 MBL fold metallo-hydrolase [Cryptosporangium phraense]